MVAGPSRSSRRGALVVISAPSGTGKTTIARALLQRTPGMRFSVSATTRPQRDGEVDGRDYFFLTRTEFERRVAAGEFVEWEDVYGDLYGTLRSELERAAAAGEHLVFDVDVKGGLSIKQRYPEALLVFIRPPDLSTLQRRLEGRGTEDPRTVARRMERVPMELDRGRLFDYQVVNDDLTRAVDEVVAIVHRYIHEAT